MENNLPESVSVSIEGYTFTWGKEAAEAKYLELRPKESKGSEVKLLVEDQSEAVKDALRLWVKNERKTPDEALAFLKKYGVMKVSDLKVEDHIAVLKDLGVV